jgi:GNAT superfamily N-acetyltransferase
MQIEVKRNEAVEPREIEDLRAEIGWDRSSGTYGTTLKRHLAWFTARDDQGRLIGYASLLSDGISDALLVDLMVHPEHRHSGIGRKLVKSAVSYAKAERVRCVQVTFAPELKRFFEGCGFQILKGGIIDFADMRWDEEDFDGTDRDH